MTQLTPQSSWGKPRCLDKKPCGAGTSELDGTSRSDLAHINSLEAILSAPARGLRHHLWCLLRSPVCKGLDHPPARWLHGRVAAAAAPHPLLRNFVADQGGSCPELPFDLAANPLGAGPRLRSGATNPVPAWRPCHGIGPGPGGGGVLQRDPMGDNGLLCDCVDGFCLDAPSVVPPCGSSSLLISPQPPRGQPGRSASLPRRRLPPVQVCVA